LELTPTLNKPKPGLALRLKGLAFSPVLPYKVPTEWKALKFGFLVKGTGKPRALGHFNQHISYPRLFGWGRKLGRGFLLGTFFPGWAWGRKFQGNFGIYFGLGGEIWVPLKRGKNGFTGQTWLSFNLIFQFLG